MAEYFRFSNALLAKDRGNKRPWRGRTRRCHVRIARLARRDYCARENARRSREVTVPFSSLGNALSWTSASPRVLHAFEPRYA
jgi:hypothetical protein